MMIPCKLDAITRRPVGVAEDELDLQMADGVSVMEDDKKLVHEAGVARLTTHRFCWISAAYTSATELRHELVASIEEHNSGFVVGLRRAQIRVTLLSGGVLRIEFGQKGREQMAQAWQDALRRRIWEKKVVAKEEFSTSGAGITGLLRKQELRSASETKSLAEAFNDMDALVSSADELVKIAGKLQKVAKSGNDTKEIAEVFSNLGVVSAITKESCGSLFHEELARQVCGFLLGSAKSLMTCGMVSLVDVYCAYNRARGTSLISPEDLYRASVIMDSLALPLRLHEFDSGVRVLQLANDQGSVEKVYQLFGQKDALAAFEVADLLNISLTVALESLLVAERDCFLCRDESIAGLVFYKNPWNK